MTEIPEIIERIKSENKELLDRLTDKHQTIAFLESLTCKDGCHPCDKCQTIFEAIEIVGNLK